VITGLLHSYALELKATVRPNFTVTQAWLRELYGRLAAAGAPIDPTNMKGAAQFYSRELEHQVARAAFGDAGAKRRELPHDGQLSKAIELLRGAPSQEALFAAASGPAGSRR
jgi:hypothetical protein